MKIRDESILFFSRVSLSKILSGSSLSFVGKRGIYIGVRMECEESGFSKQGWLVAWSSGLTELRVPTMRELNGQLSYFVL